MVFKHSFMLPPLLGILMAMMVTITYLWSISNQHVKRIFPYISDTGTWPPESCIFSLFLFASSLIMSSIIYLRFRQVRLTCEGCELKENSSIPKINKLAHYSGHVAAFGLVIVASFQETNAFWPHAVGANLAFGVGCFYQLLQTIISWRIYPKIGSKYINNIRLLLTAVSNISFWVFQIFGYLAISNFKGNNITLWNKNDGGYNYHLISTIAEWIVTVSTITYLVLYAGDFKSIIISEPEMSQT